jgi:hypothetical protein
LFNQNREKMKASELHLGDFVGVCYEDTLIAGQVIVLEPDVVHISDRKYPDSDRDIIGVPLCENWLMKLDFIYNSILKGWMFKDVVLYKQPDKNDDCWVLQSRTGQFRIEFVHELQSLLKIFSQLNPTLQ